MGKVDERMDMARKKQPGQGFTPELERVHSISELGSQTETPGNGSHLKSTSRDVPVHSHEKGIQEQFQFSHQSGDKGAKREGKLSPKKATLDVQMMHMETGRDIQSRRMYGQKTESTNRFPVHREPSEAVPQKTNKYGKVRHPPGQKVCKQLVVLVQPDSETWKAVYKP